MGEPELPPKKRQMGSTGISMGEYLIDATDPMAREEILESLRQSRQDKRPKGHREPPRPRWQGALLVAVVVTLVVGVLVLGAMVFSHLDRADLDEAPPTEAPAPGSPEQR